jgi:hypothetical protein
MLGQQDGAAVAPSDDVRLSVAPSESVNFVFMDDAAFTEGVPANFKGVIPAVQLSSLVKYIEFSPARCCFRHYRLSELGDAPGYLPIGLYGHPLDWLGRATPGARALADAIPDLRPAMEAHPRLRLLLDYSYEAGFGDEFFGLVDEFITGLRIDPSRVVLLLSNPGIARRYLRHLIACRRSVATSPRVLGIDMFLLISGVEFEKKRWFGQPESIVSVAEIDTLRNRVRPFKFVSLNRRPRWQRFILALMLSELGLRREGRVSMPSHAYRGDWWPEAHQVNLMGPQIAGGLWQRLHPIEQQVYASLPWVIDIDMDRSTHVHDYLWSHIPRQVFLESYVQVISESYVEGDIGEVFITEKTCKAIANLQPFIVFGNAGLHARLKQLGFEPPKSISTVYDAEQDVGVRLASLYVALAELRSLSMQDLHDRYYAELPALIANRERLFRMPDILGRLLARRLAELG